MIFYCFLAFTTGLAVSAIVCTWLYGRDLIKMDEYYKNVTLRWKPWIDGRAPTEKDINVDREHLTTWMVRKGGGIEDIYLCYQESRDSNKRWIKFTVAKEK